ncbi:hypothetical protein DFA_00695 [Cavenderia fasciculata]|uniref:EGF-like domain-containing protein n=1 Tax=Cavenderia fasciculata TaxID=261658 RepID=F4PT94_CACFS|nr:uncharacterized protein DFA_00695 [Cavenderia fasciculata]EGG20830.1 hypothetical protein DFA_00695 [Cavenderia fasciculata]|eukprot:XP_004358680.1 hypothetical protein DFA_00695 [Cavenderia fasciculata]
MKWGQICVDSAIWIIRQYGSELAQDVSSICSSAVFTCENGHIVTVQLSMTTTTFNINGTGAPDPSLTAIDFPECLLLDVQPFPNAKYVGDPNQSILDKLTNLPKVTSILIHDLVSPSIPVGFLKNFPVLTSITLTLFNMTVFNEQSFEIATNSIASAYLQFNILKKYPTFTNTSTSLMWRQLRFFSFLTNSTAADEPISLVFPQSVFPYLEILQIGSYADGLVSVTASVEYMFFFGYLANGFNVTVPNPDIVEYMTLNGISTVSPPLHLFTNLLTLETSHANTTTYPFSTFPPKLQKFIKYDTAITTLPYSPLPTTTFKSWEYRSLGKDVVIPWEALAPDNTSRLLDVQFNPQLSGSVPDSFCVNKLYISSTNISSVPDCFWCYRNDSTVFRTTLPLPPGFTCQPSIDNSTIYTKGFRGLIIGSNLGWGNTASHPTQGNYTLTPIVPHKILELYYKTDGTQINTVITLNEFQSYSFPLTILEVGIILSKVNVTQLPNHILEFTWVFPFINTKLIHNFKPLSDSLIGICDIYSAQLNLSSIQAIYTCLIALNQSFTTVGTSFKFEISNDYNKETYTVPFKYYPRLLSGQVDSNNQSLIYLFGDFGQNHSLANITINHKTSCSVVSSTIDAINCTLSENSRAIFGLANVSITVDGYPFEANNFLFFKNNNNNNNGSTTTGSTTSSSTTGGGTTPQTQCQESTSNCFGHGSCDVNGRCQCDSGYNPIDNCLTKFTNSTPITNTTAPTSSFKVNGTRFDFELVAIQEIDNDGNVVGELMTNSWNATINNDTTTTLVNYQLVNISNALYIDTIVQAMISFSTQPRDIQFGDQLLHINPNSIKLALNITNWQYSNLISTLRVVFRTDVNMNQTIEYDCKQQSISTFSYDQLSSTIQYLRVIKDNIQYNGRFIDYVLSDGRPTFSKTTLINQTTSQSSSTPTTTIMSTLIGVSLPQCQSCLLDPDFTPLLIDKSESDCDSTNSKTWKIIVGVVVGGFAAIAITVGAVMLLKKNRTVNRQNKKMNNKLQNMEIDSIVWIIRQYGSNIGQDAASICAAIGAFTCANGHITGVNFGSQSSAFTATAGIPNALLPSINLPECIQFALRPIVETFRGDPNQSILDKLTGLPKVGNLIMTEDSIPNIPIGFLKPFTSLVELNLNLGNVTSLQESSFEVSPNPTITRVYFKFYALKSYPPFSNSSTTLLWNSVQELTIRINESNAIAPISLEFSSTIFPNLQLLMLQSANTATIKVKANFPKMGILGSSEYGFDLTAPNPQVLQELTLNGKSTISPPLGGLYTGLIKLGVDLLQSEGYPFTEVFPPNLALFTKSFTNTSTTLPTFPLPTPNFKAWRYYYLYPSMVIPWEGLTPDSTSRFLDVSGNTGLTGSVPDSFCINRLDITNTAITSIPSCYWCYHNDTTVIKTSLAMPPGFTCQPTFDQTILYTKGFRANLTGTLLGYGNTASHPTQGNYTLTPVLPHIILTFNSLNSFLLIDYYRLYYQTNGQQQNVRILLNELSSYSVDLTLLEVGIILTSVNATQQLNQKVWFTWTFLFYNKNLQHQFKLLPALDGRNCTIVLIQYNFGTGSSIVSCELDMSKLITTIYTFSVSNAYNQETFTVPFKYYPRLLSGQVDQNNQRLVYLFGDFRQNHSSANITVNDKISCSVVSSAVDAINCTLSGSASYGPANVSIVVDGYPFEANNFLFFKNNNNGSTTTTTGSTTTSGGGTTPQTQCQESTSNCFGHGSCDVSGHCQCDSGYNPIDNCLTKYTNSTPIANTTAPTSSFEVNGTRFDFELVAIQEIDNEGIVIAELLTNSWNATINNDTTTTLVTYQLVNISNALYIDTIVQAMISFSTQPRDIQFGDQLLHINPNSIKLALNITNWQYNNLISTLRVVFRTDVNMNQTIEYDCKQQPISTFSYDQLSSTIQYLRVIKDNIQYNGRFIDYVLSDGRPTFSKTTLINQTTSQSSPSPTTIMSTLIGVSLPQCQSCLLDPDFTPLLIDNSQSDCDSTNSKTWKIIVGVVVGGFVALAIATGTVIYIKKKKTSSHQNKKMQNKLKNMS